MGEKDKEIEQSLEEIVQKYDGKFSITDFESCPKDLSDFSGTPLENLVYDISMCMMEHKHMECAFVLVGSSAICDGSMLEIYLCVSWVNEKQKVASFPITLESA